jgi:molybdopterin converting factor small subunit
MNIQVRFAEPFWRQVGQRDIKVELVQDSNTIGDLLALLCQQYPALADEMENAPPLIFIGEEEVDTKTQLADKDQVHFVWPVAGG